MEFFAKTFQELSTTEVYEILKARAEIFVMEQKILYLDMDDVDYDSLHCFFMENGKVTAYLRAFYVDQDVVRIGRVLTLEHGKGMGKELMLQCLKAVKAKMNCKKITMDAQKHAIGFYEKFGFVVTSGEFLEEEIVHVVMERSL